MKKIACLLLLTLSPGAFASLKAVSAPHIFGEELCIVENAKVEQNFRDAMLRSIAARGYRTRFVQAKTECPVTMTFNARYAMSGGYRRVLKFADFAVYRNGEVIGSANFRFSRAPFANGRVEDVIREMVERMLPSG